MRPESVVHAAFVCCVPAVTVVSRQLQGHRRNDYAERREALVPVTKRRRLGAIGAASSLIVSFFVFGASPAAADTNQLLACFSPLTSTYSTFPLPLNGTGAPDPINPGEDANVQRLEHRVRDQLRLGRRGHRRRRAQVRDRPGFARIRGSAQRRERRELSYQPDNRQVQHVEHDRHEPRGQPVV